MRVFQRDFESLVVVVIINVWLLLIASSRRTYTATEAARHILEGDGCELHRIDVDLEIEVCIHIFFSVSLSEKIPMTDDANNNNCRGRLPGAKCVLPTMLRDV